MKSLNNYLKKNILIRGTIKLWHNHLQKSIKKKKKTAALRIFKLHWIYC